ncbi:MAG: 3-isopropylmalate dehydratase [Myxococcota bacterium]
MSEAAKGPARKKGRVWKYGDDVNTDVIFPGKYTYTLREPEEIAAHALEDLDAEFARTVQPGDVVVGGSNFGCGSSREQAATCLVYCGVQAVVARSFGRTFYRNAINNGLLALICPAVVDLVESGDTLEIDLERSSILVGDERIAFAPLSGTLESILRAGGLIPHLRRRLANG